MDQLKKREKIKKMWRSIILCKSIFPKRILSLEYLLGIIQINMG